jgi:hypothetical protein
MKISVNGQELFSLNDTQLKILAHEINSDILDKDLKRRLKWVLDHEFDVAMKEFKNATLQRLKDNGMKDLPLTEEGYIKEVLKLAEFNSLPAEGENFVVDVDGQELLRFNQLKVNVFTIMRRSELVRFKPIKVDGEEALTIDSTKSVFEPSKTWKFMREKLEWILRHKCNKVAEKMRMEWEPKLIFEGAESVPASDEEFAQLIFARDDYKDRKQVDLENPL